MKTWTLTGIVKGILAAAVAGLTTLVGGWDQAMQILCVLIILDIISGVGRAVIQKDVSSRETFVGGLRKLLILVIVAVATQADLFAGSNLVRPGAIAYYCASEGLSILENVAASGVTIPPGLRDVLKALSRNKFRDKDESQDE